jgi:hypothetical protein
MKQAKNVMIILYNEPVRDVIEILRPYKWAYIKHDKDFTEEGELKKAHWHLLLSFETKKSLSLIAKVLQIEENLIECVNNYKSLERYLIHLDNPDKAQYQPSDVVSNYDYEVQVFSTTESILQFLIEKCEEYTSIKEFNLMVMKLGIDYMKVYKAYYSMIKDVIYFNNNEQIKAIQEIEQNRRSLVNEYTDNELLDIYHRLMANDKEGYNPSFAQKIINKCIERGLIACEGLIIEKGENEE